MVTSTAETETPSDAQATRERPAPGGSEGRAPTFAEEALRLGGKSADEARRTGAVDAADEQVEALFAPEYRTTSSPLYRAVWDRRVPIDEFAPDAAAGSSSRAGHTVGQASRATRAEQVMGRSLQVALRHVRSGTVYDAQGKVSAEVTDDLARAGYWGLLIDPKYGGAGASFSQFASFLTRMATVDPTVAGLASVHGCIGAVDPVRTFGSDEQKARFLPELASGRRLSGFALTEPCAGSDMTALRTTAERRGDHYVVNGEKLFITNALPGRTIALVCLIDDRPAVLVVDLPPREDEHFQLRPYELHALRHAHNYGLVFCDFRVPAGNLLEPAQGDGLTIAYHGLNRGRVSLCALAAATMRRMLADTIPWVRFRRTYGQPIGSRELVRRRLARLAGLIVACDALARWCAGLLDHGYRGEMECIIAKVFAAESQKEAAVEIYMKTHGGRSFLRGHGFGDDVHDLLAPCIYEGEGEMLSLALFKSLVKHHAQEYFEPIGKRLEAAGIRRPNLLRPRHLWVLRGPVWRYAHWWTGQRLRRSRHAPWPPMPPGLRGYAEFAAEWLGKAGLEVSTIMRKHQLKLADRQCRMAEVAGRVQAAAVILVTSLYAARQDDEVVRLAAECVCGELTRRLRCRPPSDREFRTLAETGAAVVDGGFPGLEGIVPQAILMPYAN